MSVQISIRSIALAASLVVWGVSFGGPAYAAPANNCLAAPNSPASPGQHWYYHTDRKKGRKCWFLRELNQPQQSTATSGKSATMQTTPAPSAEQQMAAPTGASSATEAAHTAASSPAKAEAAPRPTSANFETASETGRQDGQAKSAAPSFPPAPAAQASEWTDPPASTAAPTVPIIWPDLHPVETIKIRKPNTQPGIAASQAAKSNTATREPSAAQKAEHEVVPVKPVRTAQVVTSSGVTAVQMALVVVSALAVAGLLYHLVIKIAASRHRQNALRYTPPVWVDDRPQRVRRDEPRPPVSVRVREESASAAAGPQFVDGSHVSLVPAASEEGAARSPRPTETHRMFAPRKAARASDREPISEHEHHLAQLIRDLDQLLQARKRA